MNLLLDTHTLLGFALNDPQLSTAESIGVATKVVVTLRRDDTSSRGA
jgi:PIN domain nuclease of toxin-antitoxin system